MLFATLEKDGFCIIEGYFDSEPGELAAMVAAQHRVLNSWEKVKHDPPEGRSMFKEFPCSEHLLNRAMVDHPLIDNIAKRWLSTDDIHIRVGVQLARYPGFQGDSGIAHFDNGNNSLLPKPAHEVAFTPEHRRFSQMGFWTHLEPVGPGQAPLQLIRRQDGSDMSKAIPLVCTGGTVCCFPNYTWHSAGNYTDHEGQRFTWGFGVGRADHVFEGFKHYTAMGQNPHFKVTIMYVTVYLCDRGVTEMLPHGPHITSHGSLRLLAGQELISALSPAERCYFRFPKQGDPAYTPQMVIAINM